MDSVRDALGSGRPQRCRSASGRDLSGAHTDMGAVRKRAVASVRSKSRRAASLPDSVTTRSRGEMNVLSRYRTNYSRNEPTRASFPTPARGGLSASKHQ